jgi:hypothetical protein
MLRDWSDADKILFGINVELSTQTRLLGKAQCFTQLRKQLEQEKSKLETLDARSEIRASKRELFKGNVEQVIQGGLAADILLPLIQGSRHEEPPSNIQQIELFILCCCKFSKTTWGLIQGNDLNEQFADLVIDVIQGCSMLPAVVKKFTTMIEEVCGDSLNSQILSGMYEQEIVSINKFLSTHRRVQTIFSKCERSLY